MPPKFNLFQRQQRCAIIKLYYNLHKKSINFKKALQFIKNVIYFNKLIDICINCQESQKVVDNHFVGTKVLLYEPI